MEESCDNCGYSRLMPCPHLMNVTCGPAHHYPKWIMMRDIKLDPPAEDDIEKETREKMITRRRMESPMLKLKIAGVILVTIILFFAIFFFKIVKYVNQIMFAIVGMGILISVIVYRFKAWKNKSKKK